MSRPTSLGMPGLRPAAVTPPWKQAWDGALYGPSGFFRTHAPADHFRTSVHVGQVLAKAILRLLRETGLDTVVDVGSGRGELLRQLHDLDPSLTLLGVEVAPRPADLPEGIDWSAVLPTEVDGLVFAHEWLDNIPCHVVEFDEAGVRRFVHVAPDGTETLGAATTDPGVPDSVVAWLDRWWPLDEVGARAEVGSTRDRAYADLASRVTRGLTIAVDYGHTWEDRPLFGSLRSYQHGREVDVRPDGTRDVTAHVAVDAVAATTGARILRQREVLTRLGVDAALPDATLADTDAGAYVDALARSGDAAELLAGRGLGGFSWVVTEAGVNFPQ